MEVAVELSREDVMEAVEFWLRARGGPNAGRSVVEIERAEQGSGYWAEPERYRVTLAPLAEAIPPRL